MSEATRQTWQLKELPVPLCILKLDPEDTIPTWVWDDAGFVSVTKTEGEISIICAAEAAHHVDDVVGPYVGFAVDQRLGFLLTGVMSELLEPITEAGISILAMSTFDTDWILVPKDEVDEAVRAWRKQGHTVL